MRKIQKKNNRVVSLYEIKTRLLFSFFRLRKHQFLNFLRELVQLIETKLLINNCSYFHCVSTKSLRLYTLVLTPLYSYRSSIFLLWLTCDYFTMVHRRRVLLLSGGGGAEIRGRGAWVAWPLGNCANRVLRQIANSWSLLTRNKPLLNDKIDNLLVKNES